MPICHLYFFWSSGLFYLSFTTTVNSSIYHEILDFFTLFQCRRILRILTEKKPDGFFENSAAICFSAALPKKLAKFQISLAFSNFPSLNFVRTVDGYKILKESNLNSTNKSSGLQLQSCAY